MNNSSNKKIIVKLFLLALIVFAADCKNDKLETGNKTSTETSASERRKDSLKIIKSDTGAIFEGLYIINKNTNSFRDCRYPDSIYLTIPSNLPNRALFVALHRPKRLKEKTGWSLR